MSEIPNALKASVWTHLGVVSLKRFSIFFFLYYYYAADIACSTDGFGILCNALKAVGLRRLLDGDEEDPKYTVFAPTDDAFISLLSELDLDLGDCVTPKCIRNLIGKKALQNLLLFHATAGEVTFKDLVCKEDLEMANCVEDGSKDCTSFT